MLLYVRMALYFLGGWLSGLGFASFDEGTNDLTVNLDDFAVFMSGVLINVGTFIWSRIVKARGGKT